MRIRRKPHRKMSHRAIGLKKKEKKICNFRFPPFVCSVFIFGVRFDRIRSLVVETRNHFRWMFCGETPPHQILPAPNLNENQIKTEKEEWFVASDFCVCVIRFKAPLPRLIGFAVVWRPCVSSGRRFWKVGAFFYCFLFEFFLLFLLCDRIDVSSSSLAEFLFWFLPGFVPFWSSLVRPLHRPLETPTNNWWLLIGRWTTWNQSGVSFDFRSENLGSKTTLMLPGFVLLALLSVTGQWRRRTEFCTISPDFA